MADPKLLENLSKSVADLAIEHTDALSQIILLERYCDDKDNQIKKLEAQVKALSQIETEGEKRNG